MCYFEKVDDASKPAPLRRGCFDNEALQEPITETKALEDYEISALGVNRVDKRRLDQVHATSVYCMLARLRS